MFKKNSKLCFWTWNVMIENSLEVELLSKDGLAALDGTLGDCLRIVQNISIQVIASNVEYHFFQTFYNICMFPTTLSAKYFCEKSPPCCTRPQDRTGWAPCRRRGWGGPLIITIYIFWWMHSKLGWKCGMISYISGVRSYLLPESCARRSRGRAATFPTCLPACRQSRRTPWSARDWTPVWEDLVNQNII